MNTLRLFVGFPLAQDWKKKVQLLQKMHGEYPGLNWTNLDNLHITLAFIGKTDSRHIPLLTQKISKEIQKSTPVVLRKTELTYIAKREKPAMIWLRWEPGKSFIQLTNNLHQSIIDTVPLRGEATQPMPHVTLARMGRSYTAETPDLPTINLSDSITINHCILYNSRLHPVGPEYIPLKVFPFRK